MVASLFPQLKLGVNEKPGPTARKCDAPATLAPAGFCLRFEEIPATRLASNHPTMKRGWHVWIIAGSLSLASQTTAFAGGEEVVVVYNSQVRESKALAEYYAKKRNVPHKQVFGFSLPTGQSFNRAEFREDLQKALWNKLESAN